MKRILCITLLLGLGLAAQAQRSIHNNLSIVNLTTRITGETLELDFDVRATGIDLSACDGQLILEFAVETADHRLILPVVVYSSSVRSRYEARRRLLSDAYSVEPYHVYDNVRTSNAYKLDYRLSIPYQQWMGNAELTFRQYMHDCSGARLADRGVLTADLGSAPAPAPPVAPSADYAYTPPPPARSSAPAPVPASAASDPLPAPILVVTVTPAERVWKAEPITKQVRTRTAMLELPIGFPVDRTEVIPDFGNNRRELARVDSLFRALSENSRVQQINSIDIRGYASPESSYAYNERLARRRSDGFHRYLRGHYPGNEPIEQAQVSWVAEDWDGLEKLVEARRMTHKEEILAVIRDQELTPDARDKALQEIEPWSEVYKPMLSELYPQLRRIELVVHYTEKEN